MATYTTPDGVKRGRIHIIDRWLQTLFVEGAEGSVASQLTAYGKFHFTCFSTTFHSKPVIKITASSLSLCISVNLLFFFPEPPADIDMAEGEDMDVAVEDERIVEEEVEIAEEEEMEEGSAESAQEESCKVLTPIAFN